MLLITRAADDIELVECTSGRCEFVAIRDEVDDLGWGRDLDDEWLCERCLHDWAASWGITITPPGMPRKKAAARKKVAA